MSYEEAKNIIERNIAEIDKRVEETRRKIKDQLEIGFMAPERLERFVNLLNITITLMDNRRKFVEYAKILEIDIR